MADARLIGGDDGRAVAAFARRLCTSQSLGREEADQAGRRADLTLDGGRVATPIDRGGLAAFGRCPVIVENSTLHLAMSQAIKTNGKQGRS